MILDMHPRQILASARTARAQSGRSILSQLAEILRLRRGPGKISAREYFDYRLFEPSLSDAERDHYVGRWVKRQVYQAQDVQWTGVGNDKLLAYLFFKANGFPYAPVKAVYDERRYYPDAQLLSSQDALAAWLRDKANYPFFSKPATGAFGDGSCFASDYDAATDSIVTVNGDRIGVVRYAGDNWQKYVGGLLFQEVIQPHPALVALIGNRVATARIVTITAPDAPVIHRAVFRLPMGRNFTDNFNLGSSGNGFATIDIASGTLLQAYKGIGLSLTPMDIHADTGQPLMGFVLPHWDRAIAMVSQGQRALAGLRILGWDIAFTAEGPLVVEFNTHPGYAILQAAGQGLADAAFREQLPADLAETKRRYRNIIIGT